MEFFAWCLAQAPWLHFDPVIVPASLFARERSYQTKKERLQPAPFQEEGVAGQVMRCQQAAQHANDTLKQRHLAVPAQLIKASVTVWLGQKGCALPGLPMVQILPHMMPRRISCEAQVAGNV